MYCIAKCAGICPEQHYIPVNYAERIEVCKGGAVGFGTDALGGVINIITGKHRKGWSLDASYTYGSFNTNRTLISHTFQREDSLSKSMRSRTIPTIITG